jgi:hypothetical protein
MIFQHRPLSRDQKHAVFLIADADFPDAALRRRTRRQESYQSHRQLKKFPTSHESSWRFAGRFAPDAPQQRWGDKLILSSVAKK